MSKTLKFLTVLSRGRNKKYEVETSIPNASLQCYWTLISTLLYDKKKYKRLPEGKHIYTTLAKQTDVDGHDLSACMGGNPHS